MAAHPVIGDLDHASPAGQASDRTTGRQPDDWDQVAAPDLRPYQGGPGGRHLATRAVDGELLAVVAGRDLPGASRRRPHRSGAGR